MKILKKVLLLAIVCALTLSVCACHGKDETAVTVGDVKITSAVYMCALITADGEAREKVDEENNTEEAAAVTNATIQTDYLKQKIDGKSYSNWVKDRALEICKTYAAYEIKCKENKIELSEDQTSSLNNYVDYYWNTYGYESMYTPNGVSYNSFKESMKYSYLASAYFDSIYGKDGTKAVSEDEIKTAIEKNFVIADMINVDTSSMSAEEADAELVKLQGYKDRINGGVAFDTIYKEHNNTTEDTPAQEDGPKDPYATVLGAEGTVYESEYFTQVSALEIGKADVVKSDSSVTLLVRGDLFGDEYWVDYLNSPTLSLLKQDEFDADIEKFADTLTAKVNKYAVNRFKVKKIKYPETEQ